MTRYDLFCNARTLELDTRGISVNLSIYNFEYIGRDSGVLFERYFEIPLSQNFCIYEPDHAQNTSMLKSRL